MRRMFATLLLLTLPATGLARNPAQVELRDAEQQTITLAEITAQQELTLLNFWATWCAPCRTELPLLLEAELGADMALFAVNLAESPESVNKYLASNNLNDLPVLYISGRNSALLPIPGLPSSLLIGRSGKILTTHYGAFTAESLASFLAEWSPKP